MKRTILVFDGRQDRCKSHCTALVKHGFAVWKWEDERIVACHGSTIKKPPTSWDLILLHSPGSDADKFAAKSLAGAVLRYGGGGGQGNDFVPRAVNAASPLTPDEIKRFTDFFFSKGGKIPAAIAATWAHEPKLALRLLCEAWEFTQGKPSKAEIGIQINAPTSPAHWFAPFGKRPSVKSTNEIAAMMASATDQARTFLMTICKVKGKSLTVDNSLKKQIAGLRKALTNAVI